MMSNVRNVEFDRIQHCEHYSGYRSGKRTSFCATGRTVADRSDADLLCRGLNSRTE